jgi:excisionase family DNA binding protein
MDRPSPPASEPVAGVSVDSGAYAVRADDDARSFAVEVARELATLLAAAVEQARAPAHDREPWLTVGQAAAYAATSEDTIRDWIARGRLPAGRAGREWRVRASAIDAMFLDGSAEARPKTTVKASSSRALELIGELDDDSEGGAHG